MFEVTGDGPDAESAMRSTGIVLEEASRALADLQVQQGADPEYLISSTPLEAPSTATAMYGSTMRAAIAVVAVGGLGTLGLAVLAEITGQRRAASQSASRRGRVDADAHDGGDPDAEDDAVEATESNGPARGRIDAYADPEVVVEATGSNGSARGRVDAEPHGGGDPDAEDDAVEATGSNGSARGRVDAEPHGGGDPDAEDDAVEATGSNGSARRRVDSDSDGEAAEEATSGPADSRVAAGSARSRAAGRGLGIPAGSRSFNSARIVPDGSSRSAAREGRNGSPAWGRAASAPRSPAASEAVAS